VWYASGKPAIAQGCGANNPNCVTPDRQIWANDFGAVCNGSTDDSIALQNTINVGQSLGIPVKFKGPCAINSALSMTASVDFSGATPQAFLIASHQGIIVANQNVGDSGDSTIDGSLIQVGSGGIGIVYNSSGGLRIINNKINGNGTVLFGIQMALAPGVFTADLFVTGNSIEGISGTGAGIALQRAGSTGGFEAVMITGNELSGGFCLLIPFDANGVWLSNLTATGNTCLLQGSSTAVGFFMDSINGATVTSNFVQGVSTGTNIVFAIGPHGLTAANCVIGITPYVGLTSAASTLGSCTAIAPH
jgi:hypothetical protein